MTPDGLWSIEELKRSNYRFFAIDLPHYCLATAGFYDALRTSAQRSFGSGEYTQFSFPCSSGPFAYVSFLNSEGRALREKDVDGRDLCDALLCPLSENMEKGRQLIRVKSFDVSFHIESYEANFGSFGYQKFSNPVLMCPENMPLVRLLRMEVHELVPVR